jgi:hypothetical protein
MTTARFKMPDGRVARFEVPDGTTPEQAQSLMEAHFAGQGEKPTPVKLGKEGMGDALKQTLAGAGWMERNLAGIGSAPALALEGMRYGSANPENVTNQKMIAESAPVGNILGNVGLFAPTAAIPGANTMTGAALIGAATNALTTPGSSMDRFKAAGMGAVGGAAGTGLAGLLSRATPAAVPANVGLLQREGVSLTPGQNIGGAMKSLEDKATSWPLIGNVINSARTRGIEDFNRAAIGRVTAPMDAAGIPLQVSGVGRTAMQDMRTGLGDAYDTVLARSSANALEPTFVQNMANLRQLVSGLPAQEARAFNNIIDREIAQRMAPNGMINAENLQMAKSGLGTQATNFATSSDAYQRNLGQALKQAQVEFQDLVRRSNPQNASELKAIDTAYANFKRLQRAAAGVGAEEGVFTPAQLYSATKAMDKTKDKRAFSEGSALLQDLAEAGKSVLPSKVPDSGTPGRLMANILNPLMWPGLTLSAAASIPAYAAYSRPGAALINGIYNQGAIPARNALADILGNNPNALRLLGMSAPKLMGE